MWTVWGISCKTITRLKYTISLACTPLEPRICLAADHCEQMASDCVAPEHGALPGHWTTEKSRHECNFILINDKDVFCFEILRGDKLK